MNYQILNGRSLFWFLTGIFFLRIVYSYFLGWSEIPSDSDGVGYNEYALSILNKPDWLVNPDFIGNNRPPVYSVFIALIYSIFGVENYFAVYLFQALLNALTCYYIFKLSEPILGEKKSFLAALWSGLYAYYFLYSGMITRETLVFFLIIYSFYHLWRFFEQGKYTHFLRSKNLWKFIISFAILSHTDTRYLFYIPFLSILFAFYNERFIAGTKQYFCVLGILILLLVPWLIRNYIAYNGFVLINTLTLTSDKADIDYNRRLNMLTTRRMNEVSREHAYSFEYVNNQYPSDEERILIKQGKNPGNRTENEIRLIMNDIYPATSFLERKLYYVVNMWVPFRFWWDYTPFPQASVEKPWSMKHNLISILFYGTLIPFVFYGIFNLIKTKQKAVWFLVFPIVAHAVLHFLMWGRERYRNHIDAFIIILGCYGLVVAFDHFKKGAKHECPIS